MTIGPVILHIDDSEDDRLLFSRALEHSRFHWRLRSVANSSEALLLLNTIGPFDRLSLPRLVLLDLALPPTDGRELLRLFSRSALFRSLPVVVLSGALRPGDVEECLALGAKAVLTKPTMASQALDLVVSMQRFMRDPTPTSPLPILPR